MTRREKTACMETFHQTMTMSMHPQAHRIPIPSSLRHRQLRRHQHTTFLLLECLRRLRSAARPFPVAMSRFTRNTTTPLPTIPLRLLPSQSASMPILRTPTRARPRVHHSLRTAVKASITHVLRRQTPTTCLSDSSEHVTSDKPTRWATPFPFSINLPPKHPQIPSFPLPNRSRRN